MRSSYKQIGSFVKQVNVRNKNLSVKDLQGINIDKLFMPSVANTNGVDLSNYKIVTYKQFAFNPMHVGRDEVLPIGLLTSKKNIIVSPAYIVFEVTDEGKLLPEYLMMWCRRLEFDRNAWFTTDSSVRGGFSWDDFCNMSLPVPPIEKQREIVREYHTIVDRIKLNEKLNQKLEETARAIYKQWFEDFEFPISKQCAASIGRPDLEGKPYKSSGAPMTWNDDLSIEIPVGWQNKALSDVTCINYGKSLPANRRKAGNIPVFSSAGLTGFHNSALINEESIIVGRKGSIGTLFYVEEPCFCIDTAYFIRQSDSSIPLYYLYMLLKQLGLNELNEDSAVPGLNRNTVYAIKFALPESKLLQKFSTIKKTIGGSINSLCKELNQLNLLQSVLFSKLTRVEAIS